MKELECPTFIQQNKIIAEVQIKAKIMKICEEHKIRLTPLEYNELIDDYINHFINSISVVDVIQLSDNVRRRHS